MRYRVRVSRVQVAERVVSAKDEDSALERVRHQLAEPYGFFGWDTKATDAEIVGVAAAIAPGALAPDGGPLLLAVKDAARHLGISYSTLYELVARGEIEHVEVGRRRFISRTAIEKFIEANSRAGRAPT